MFLQWTSSYIKCRPKTNNCTALIYRSGLRTLNEVEGSELRYKFVLGRELQVHLEAFTHRVVDGEGNVVREIADQIVAQEADVGLVVGGDLGEVVEAFVAGGGEVDGDVIAAGHPHGEDEAEASVRVPEFGEVEGSVGRIVWKPKCGIADDESGV